jgi:heme exporter protein D
MHFESVQALIDMEGHGSYVWAAYAIAIVVILSLVIQPLRAKKQFIRVQKNELRRQQRSQSNRSNQ